MDYSYYLLIFQCFSSENIKLNINYTKEMQN